MGKYFGTDGIRGVAGETLGPEFAFRVGQAAAMALSEKKAGKPLFTIGKDTRISGDMLEAALISGLCAAGANVVALGVIPTPAVAYITPEIGADAGVVISASHNPYEHNGIKIFSGRGYKLPDETELEIEALIDSPSRLEKKTLGEIGHLVDRGLEPIDRYISHVISCAEAEIADLRVLIDCANGAASRTARSIFGRFNIDFEIINDHPDGVNINSGCGSTHLETLGRLVPAGRYDLGIAFDGDADRCMAVDENGKVVDGDRIMGICGRYLKDLQRLGRDTIVATVMSNIGFHEYARRSGISLVCTAVGDRHVLECMQENGYSLGGEQSGHIIFLGDATTGDGQLTAVKFLSVLSATGQKLSEAAALVPQYPQVLKNLPVEGGNAVKEKLMTDEELRAEFQSEDEKLGERGRVLVRASGTEPLIRVMVEAETQEAAEKCADQLLDSIKKRARLLI